jgi:hypothetical protein
MKFSVEQKYDRAAAEVIACYCDADSYAHWPTGGHLSSPEVLSVVHSQPTVTVSLRYRFVASLPSAALAIIDPDKLTWVEESIYDLNRLSFHDPPHSRSLRVEALRLNHNDLSRHGLRLDSRDSRRVSSEDSAVRGPGRTSNRRWDSRPSASGTGSDQPDPGGVLVAPSLSPQTS